MTSRKTEALIEREGAAYIVAAPDFITSSEVLAVEAAHAYAHEQQEQFREHLGDGGYYLPTIYRIPLNTLVRLEGKELYAPGGGSWGQVGDRDKELTALDEKLREIDERRRLFAADRPEDDDRRRITTYPHDPTVSDWVWTQRHYGSLWRARRMVVFVNEERAITATKPDEPLFGIHPGGRTTAGLHGPDYLIRGYFRDTRQWGYRSGHGVADLRHPSHG